MYTGSGCSVTMIFFFQAEDGIRDLVRSRGLGDVYKRQHTLSSGRTTSYSRHIATNASSRSVLASSERGSQPCLLYTSDAADERSSVDLGGRRIIKKKKKYEQRGLPLIYTNSA